jgi:hypothetical protein
MFMFRRTRAGSNARTRADALARATFISNAAATPHRAYPRGL